MVNKIIFFLGMSILVPSTILGMRQKDDELVFLSQQQEIGTMRLLLAHHIAPKLVDNATARSGRKEIQVDSVFNAKTVSNFLACADAYAAQEQEYSLMADDEVLPLVAFLEHYQAYTLIPLLVTSCLRVIANHSSVQNHKNCPFLTSAGLKIFADEITRRTDYSLECVSGPIHSIALKKCEEKPSEIDRVKNVLLEKNPQADYKHVVEVAIADNKDYVALAGGNRVHLINARLGQEIVQLVHSSVVHEVGFSAGTQFFCSKDLLEELFVYDIQKKEKIAHIINNFYVQQNVLKPITVKCRNNDVYIVHDQGDFKIVRHTRSVKNAQKSDHNLWLTTQFHENIVDIRPLGLSHIDDPKKITVIASLIEYARAEQQRLNEHAKKASEPGMCTRIASLCFDENKSCSSAMVLCASRMCDWIGYLLTSASYQISSQVRLTRTHDTAGLVSEGWLYKGFWELDVQTRKNLILNYPVLHQCVHNAIEQKK